ncbi:hypothetical protein TURU_019005 [Turdus rufiventris]|nr:hypothetical protein TURU_019005 [Turdus rufiventris]
MERNPSEIDKIAETQKLGKLMGVIVELVFVETGEKPECDFEVLYLDLVDRISGSHLLSACYYFCSLFCIASLFRASVADPGKLPENPKIPITGISLRSSPTFACSIQSIWQSYFTCTSEGETFRLGHDFDILTWINNCVGEDNHWLFLQLCFYTQILSSYTLILDFCHYYYFLPLKKENWGTKRVEFGSSDLIMDYDLELDPLFLTSLFYDNIKPWDAARKSKACWNWICEEILRTLEGYLQVHQQQKKGQQRGPGKLLASSHHLIITPGNVIILEAMTKHIKEMEVIRNSQDGLAKGKSCLTNLMAFCDGMAGWVEKGKAVNVVYLSFSKAFDTVSHNILIGKLRKCGLEEWTVGWIKNWLNGRAQRVMISVVQQEICSQWYSQGINTGTNLIQLVCQ